MKKTKISNISVTDFEGTGEPLIFVHAFPLCSRMWDKQAEYFKDKYRVILYDARGLGYSNELDNYQYTMEDFADDLLMIMDELKIESANVCGLSMGGYTILRAMTKQPQKFKAVILADTRSERDDNTGLLGRSAAINKLKHGSKEDFKKEFTKKLLSEESYKSNELRSFVEEMISWQDVNGICGALIALATRTTTTEDLKKINIPALIICGGNDILTPLKFSEQMHSALKNSRLVVVPGAGHLTNMESPDFFNKAVEQFLSEEGD